MSYTKVIKTVMKLSIVQRLHKAYTKVFPPPDISASPAVLNSWIQGYFYIFYDFTQIYEKLHSHKKIKHFYLSYLPI